MCMFPLGAGLGAGLGGVEKITDGTGGDGVNNVNDGMYGWVVL